MEFFGTLSGQTNGAPDKRDDPALRQLIYSHGLVDVWRRTHADCRQYTWSHLRESRISSAKLDHFYVCVSWFYAQFCIYFFKCVKLCSLVLVIIPCSFYLEILSQKASFS